MISDNQIPMIAEGWHRGGGCVPDSRRRDLHRLLLAGQRLNTLSKQATTNGCWLSTGSLNEIGRPYGGTAARELPRCRDGPSDRRADLIQLAREARKKGWWIPYRGVLKQGFSDYLAFESEADSFRSYQVHLIHGLLQTEEFARAVLRTSRVLRTPEEIDRAVEARIARQQRLTSTEHPLQMWQIIEEGALRRTIGDAVTMRAQLDHILGLARLPNVSIQVIPYRSATHVALDGPFELLGFDDYPDVLYVEHFGGCRFFEKPEETTDAKVVLDHLRSSALNTADSAALIKRVAEEMYES
jgi:uncharacterized protein DUF5753